MTHKKTKMSPLTKNKLGLFSPFKNPLRKELDSIPVLQLMAAHEKAKWEADRLGLYCDLKVQQYLWQRCVLAGLIKTESISL
jgi:hypothetical protein